MRDSSSLSEAQREAAVALFETGWGAKSVATRLGVRAEAVSGLYDRCRVRGGTTLVTKPTKRLFSFEFKFDAHRLSVTFSSIGPHALGSRALMGARERTAWPASWSAPAPPTTPGPSTTTPPGNHRCCWCAGRTCGLKAARGALIQWAAAPAVDLLGLAVLADAPGKLPKPLRESAALVGGERPGRGSSRGLGTKGLCFPLLGARWWKSFLTFCSTVDAARW
jgi:hypothetical protein